MNAEKIKATLDLVRAAESEGLMWSGDGLDGFSGSKLVGLLQRLAAAQSASEEAYLEIGVFQGLTLLSVAGAFKGGVAYGIDNFSQFDPQGTNQSIVLKRAEKNGINNYKLINSDYEDALEHLDRYLDGRKIGVYFVDGPHDYRSQLVCLEFMRPYLSDSAVIIVDDCNYAHVRQANRDFLVAHKEFKLLFESYTAKHPHNMSAEEIDEARRGWWDGVNIIVRDDDDCLTRTLPPTIRSRECYENEHIVHSSKYASQAIRAVELVGNVLDCRLLRAAKNAYDLLRNAKEAKRKAGVFRYLNTHSEDLPRSNYIHFK